MYLARQKWILVNLAIAGSVLAAGMMFYYLTLDIAKLQTDNRQLRSEIANLHQVIEYKTHPQTIQYETIKWILREE